MTDMRHDTNPEGPDGPDDEASLEELRRLSAKFVVMGVQTDAAELSGDDFGVGVDEIIDRLSKQHQSMDQGVGKVLFRVNLLKGYLYFLFFHSAYTLVRFYLTYEKVTDLSLTFRLLMVAFAVVVFILTNITFRTHGTLLSRVNIQGMLMIGLCTVALMALPGRIIPPSLVVLFLGYFHFRRDNRNRTFVFLVVVVACSIAALLNPWMPNPIYPAFFGSIFFGMGASLLLRQAATFRSGGTILSKTQFDTWWDYPKARENLGPLDVILESENRYAPSRITTLSSRSPWTHTGLIVKNPSDRVKTLYGLATHAELMSILAKKIQSATHTDDERATRNRAIASIEQELNEELYVFEAVRPVVALTPLCTWMAAKEENMSYKVVVCRRLKMYEGRAKVILDMEALEDLMVELHGTPFALKAQSMVKANYQLNRERFKDSIFCSELVAEAYQRVGLLTEKRLSSNFTPKDFSSAEQTKLLMEARFEPEVRLRDAVPDFSEKP